MSVHIELEGIDICGKDAFAVHSGKEESSLTNPTVQGKRRKILMTNLSYEIDGVELVRKKGKSTVVLKLVKYQDRPWRFLHAHENKKRNRAGQ